MTWLTWRQFRAQAIVAAAALAVVAIAQAVTGPHLAHLFASSGVATCQAHGTCGTDVTAFMDQLKSAGDTVVFFLSNALLGVTPALIGIFWGAPLIAREIEAGTFRLAWSQSVTRLRWLAVKLGLIGLASMATVALLSFMVTWWASPIDRANGLPDGRNGTTGLNHFSPELFLARGIAPIGYAAFAFALGVTAGLLLRRTVPAMGDHPGRVRRLPDRHAAVDPAPSPPAAAHHRGAQRRQHRRLEHRQQRLHKRERGCEPAGGLGALQPGRHPGRTGVQRAGPDGVHRRHRDDQCVLDRARQARSAATGDLPAGQPVLGLPVA